MDLYNVLTLLFQPSFIYTVKVFGRLIVHSQQPNLSLFQERVRLQRDLLTVEKAAEESHKQARILQEQLRTISQELLCLKDKVQTGNSTVTHHICLL